MRHRNGWIKLHRSVFQHWVGQDAYSFSIWAWLIGNANREDGKYFDGKNVRKIGRGELITSSREIGAALNIDRKTVMRRLEAMKKELMIEMEMGHSGTHIKILNFKGYQDSDKTEWDTERTTERTTEGTTERTTEGTLNGEYKNIRSKEDENISTPPTPDEKIIIPEVIPPPPEVREKKSKPEKIPSPDFLSIGEQWLKFAQGEMPWKIKDPKWNPTGFGNELERVAQKLNITPKGMNEILNWISKDEFWRKNAVSPFGLLNKSKTGDMRKIDHIIGRMKTKRDRELEAAQRFINSTEEYKFPF